MNKYICIDIGGTAIKYGVIDDGLNFLTFGEMPTEAYKGGPEIMEKVKSVADSLIKEYQTEGIAVSTAGMVDCEEGKITYAAPLIPEYTGTPVRAILEREFGLPCEVENDVNCAGLAESLAGAAKGCGICVCLTVGTGIGGAILINGKVLHGFSGSACEVGYMHLPGGAFQDLGAASVLVSKVEKESGLPAGSIDGKSIFDRAKAGDTLCIRAIDEMAEILGMGIANICYIVNPEVVVLGGGMMSQRAYLEPRISRALDRYLLPSVRKNTKLEFARFQNHAGMIGASLHFRQKRGI